MPVQQPFRSALAERLMLQGIAPQTQPVQSWGEGLARTGTQLVQALLGRKLMEQEKAKQQEQAGSLATALLGKEPIGEPTVENAPAMGAYNSKRQQLSDALSAIPQLVPLLQAKRLERMIPPAPLRGKERYGAIKGPYGGERLFDYEAMKYFDQGQETPQGGPFRGKSMDAQTLNILLNGDPSSPEYTAAYKHYSQPRVQIDQNTGAMVAVQPDMSSYRRPGTPAAVQPAPSAVQPATPPAGPTRQRLGSASVTTVPPVRPKPTVAEAATDKAMAKTYQEMVVEGGFADMEKNISQLRDVRDQLVDPETGKARTDKLTGPTIGVQPRWLRALTTPDSLAAQEAVEEVVQRNLRLVLGAQFTEKEGERLISRSYNPLLGEEENGKRLTRLLGAIEKAYQAKRQAAEYYEKNGTMKGYEGAKLMTLSDIEREAGLGGKASVAVPKVAPPSIEGIPQAAVDHLKANPSLRDSFDQKYGAGAAARVLGQ